MRGLAHHSTLTFRFPAACSLLAHNVSDYLPLSDSAVYVYVARSWLDAVLAYTAGCLGNEFNKKMLAISTRSAEASCRF